VRVQQLRQLGEVRRHAAVAERRTPGVCPELRPWADGAIGKVANAGDLSHCRSLAAPRGEVGSQRLGGPRLAHAANTAKDGRWDAPLLRLVRLWAHFNVWNYVRG